MIVLDTSAIIAILTNEPERQEFELAIANAVARHISVINYQEAAQVMFGRHGERGLQKLEEYLSTIEVQFAPYTYDLAAKAIGAFKRYGKGINASTRLNMCDCAAYALATSLDAPLLYKGNDFAGTDVKPWR